MSASGQASSLILAPDEVLSSSIRPEAACENEHHCELSGQANIGGTP